MKTFLECVVMCAIAAGYSVAAEKSEGNAPQPKDLAWLLGEWEGEYVLPEGVPEIGPAGARIVSRHTWRWTLDRKFIALKILETIDGTTVSTGDEILGTDQSTGALAHWFFGSSGGHGSGQWLRNGDRWELKWQATFPGEKEYTGTSDHIRIDDNAYTWQLKNLTENGKPIPDWPKVTFRRRVAAPAGDLWEAWRDAAAGTWHGTGTAARDYSPDTVVKGDQFTMQFSLKSEMEGAALVGETDYQLANRSLKLSSRTLAGWDPQAQQVRAVAFWSKGLVEETLISSREGRKFFGTYTARIAGSPVERVRISIDYRNPDSYVVTILDGPRKGQILSSWKRAN